MSEVAENPVVLFDRVKEYVGNAIHDVRMGCQKTEKEVYDDIRNRGFTHLVGQLPLIESGTFHLFFEEFEALCRALSMPIDVVLERAAIIKCENGKA